tara:strand:+ start:527 stop:853 length:327 start_codon:yes stop_codon:yes gene_type:complete
MAQHDYNIANQGFPSFRSDLNNVLSAINTNNLGTTAPGVTSGTTAVQGQIFADTATTNKIIFKYYNGSAFVTVFEVATNSATATIPSSVNIEGESDPNAIPFAIALGG